MASERTRSDRPDVGVDYRVDQNAVVTTFGLGILKSTRLARGQDKSGQMCGWFRLEMILASRSNRWRRSGSSATCAKSTLTGDGAVGAWYHGPYRLLPFRLHQAARESRTAPSRVPASSGISRSSKLNSETIQAGVGGFVDLAHGPQRRGAIGSRRGRA